LKAISQIAPIKVAYDGSEVDEVGALDTETGIAAVLRALMESERLKQSDIVERVNVRQSHLSRWLNTGYEKKSEQGSQIPMRYLTKVARALNRIVFVAFVDRALTTRQSSREPASRRLREFLLGMGYINLRDRPNSVLQLLADVMGAKSWMLYGESPGRNILQCTPGESILNPELVAGPSWASELPTRVLNINELFLRDWTEEGEADRSAFAVREEVAACVGLPIHSDGARSHVVFLNFSRPPSPKTLDRDVLLTITTTLRGFLNSSASNDLEDRNSEQKAVLPCSAVAELLGHAFRNERTDQIGQPLRDALTASISQWMWPGHTVFPEVWALDSARVSLSEKPKNLRFTHANRNGAAGPDYMVRRAAANGETFYINDLKTSNVRGRFDREELIPERTLQKIVIPIRSERLLESTVEPRPDERGLKDGAASVRQNASSDKEVLYYLPPPERRDANSWGAISVESAHRVFLQDNVLELSMVAHLVACVLHVRGLERAKGLLGSLVDGIHGTLQRIKDGAGVGHASAWDPLAPLCQAVVEREVFEGIQRCDIYPFDHNGSTFLDGGAYTHPDWITRLRSDASVLLDDTDDRVKHLTPRRGGNSERLIGTREVFQFILDAQSHSRVSPITKMMGTKSLIGCSCRVGASFKSDAVIWLGSTEQLPDDYLAADNFRRLTQLRIVACIAAIFCVPIRWWSGSGADVGGLLKA